MYAINKVLKKLSKTSILGFDVETRSVYSKENIAEAVKLLKEPELVATDYLVFLKQVARTTGLSFPPLVKTTHFIFGLSREESVILIAPDKKTEERLWNWLVNYKGKLLIHNTGFDLKICHHRTNKFPVDFEDTQLLSKCYLNNSNSWKAKVSLKHLMSYYYDPKWSMFDDYDIKNLRDDKFLDYAAIDGAAVYYLYELLEDERLERSNP